MKGKCLCGEIEFEIKATLSNVYQCSCSVCRKASGTSKSSSFITPIDSIKWIKGDHLISSFTYTDGFRTNFCRICGSPVPNKMKTGKYMCIPAGSIDDEINREILAKIFIDSKASWDKSSKYCKELSEGPDDLEEFIGFLHQDINTTA